jgi:adhesin transport system membrane fusion protein
MSDDKEFMEELEAATRMKPSERSHYLLIAIAALVGSFLIWSNISEIEEITHGVGQVVPTQEIQIVQSLEGGIIKGILVSEGMQVKKGQILLKVSDIAFASEGRGAAAKSLSLQAKKARLEAEAQGKEFIVPVEIVEKFPDIARNEKALYQSRQQELENAKSILNNKISSAASQISEVRAKINRFSESRRLLNQELIITKQMVAKKAVPKLEEIRLNRELANLSGQIREASEERRGLEAELSRTKKEREDREDKFKSQVLGELNDIETQISQIGESITAIEDRVSRTDIRSPVDGVVNKIMLKTIGGVIEPAMQLFEIVPLDDDLKIVARVTPQEIAFLRPSQPANIKISAYDSQRYGSLKGKIIRLGANSVTDREGNAFFEIELRADKNYLGTVENPLPITPGMVAEIEIITGKRTIFSYLVKPVLRAKDRALTER